MTAFWSDRRGATAVEYGLIVSLIFLVIVTAVSAFANSETSLFNRVSNAVAAAV